MISNVLLQKLAYIITYASVRARFGDDHRARVCAEVAAKEAAEDFVKFCKDTF